MLWKIGVIHNNMRIYDVHDRGGDMREQSVPKKMTNLMLDQGLLSEARSFG